MNLEKKHLKKIEQWTELLKELLKSEPEILNKVIKEKNNANLKGVYLISDPKDSKILYVGETADFLQRMKDHKSTNGSSDLNEKIRYHGLRYGKIDYYKVRFIQISKQRAFFEDFAIGVLTPLFNEK